MTASAVKLSRTAAALRRQLLTGDSLACEIIGGSAVWTLTTSGLAVRGRDVEELLIAGELAPFGDHIDPAGAPACFVLANPAPKAGTACGADSIAACRQKAFCIDCAPAGVAKIVRSGELPVNGWIGPA